jgi:hypothetical protein
MEYKGMNLVAPIGVENKTFEDLTAHHINAVSLVPYAYVNLEDASVNYNNERQWWGERTDIIASNQMAHDHKMTVMLKPHLWANHGFYTGDLDFQVMPNEEMGINYEKYILDFAQLAQNENIELFCFGTELGTQ